MAQPIVEAIQLTKAYEDVKVVDRLDLKIDEGQIFGFLGPNGAGKTTTILMLLGLTEPTSGEARVCGYNATRDPLHVKRITGYLPENVGFYEDMTAAENLRYIIRLNGISDKQATEKIGEVLQIVGLDNVTNQEVGKFSKGMKQRLGIACVLAKEPRLVVLDEPTTGIDPEGVNEILDLIGSMAKDKGIAVLLCSHLLHQVQRICDRVGIVSKGRMVAEGLIQQMGKKIIGGGQNELEVQVNHSNAALIRTIKSIPSVISVDRSGHTLSVRSNEDVRDKVAQAIFEGGSLPLQMKSQDYALEEIYMKYFREA
ncbi:ABC transporter ATP-binding protein [Chloroflexota bacterium]